ncbi:MAG: PqqD family protein [Bacteriovoracaceae bacterium]|nr:PqqD family protein [Bacteriovoracaceae bacterium]
MFRLKLGWKLRKIGKTIFLTNEVRTFEISEISYSILRYITRPRTLDEISDFILDFFENIKKDVIKKDMKELMKDMVSRGVVHAVKPQI